MAQFRATVTHRVCAQAVYVASWGDEGRGSVIDLVSIENRLHHIVGGPLPYTQIMANRALDVLGSPGWRASEIENDLASEVVRLRESQAQLLSDLRQLIAVVKSRRFNRDAVQVLVEWASQCLEMFEHDDPSTEEYVVAFNTREAIDSVRLSAADAVDLGTAEVR